MPPTGPGYGAGMSERLGLHLTPADDREREIAALCGSIGDPVGVAGVVAGMTRLARPSRTGRVLGRAVSEAFRWHGEQSQLEVRQSLGIQNAHLLLNVKRLHPLAGQRFLIEAMNEVIRLFPDTRLVICGTGDMLEELKSVARSAGVERHVTFAGMIDNTAIARYCAAADLFVLPSILEALPTVAVEALASGTPVLSSDNPGGLELNDVFGPDVSIVPREQSMALAAAIGDFLQHKRRTLGRTQEAIDREFRPDAVAAQYRDIYDELTGS